MSAESPMKVVLCWHMHQPEYRDCEGGQYELPWTYLHAIKDYVDMAAIIEKTPGARAVVNFAPILLEQIADYAEQIRAHFDDDRPLRDPLLAALAMPVLPTDEEHRLWLIKACLRANRQRLIERFPPYRRIADLASCVEENPGTIKYLDAQFLADIVMWYHLAWLGETVRRDDDRAKALMAKGSGFSSHDRRIMLGLIGELISGVIGRYKRLAEEGRIELSMTPYAHPIVPLLLDLHSAREAMPEANLPLLFEYPDGEERTKWHIDEGRRVFEHYFGLRPRGCWPSEGAVSKSTLKLLGDAGFDWAASGESVLRNSLASSEMDDIGCIHRAYSPSAGKLTCFFRDDGLSDQIGFTYSGWHGDDAASNLVHHLENIAGACKGVADPVVSIILDGENAWEYYPENAFHFLSAMYEKLAEHPGLELTTFSDYLEPRPETVELPDLVAGSWVYGTLSTWIGDADKNRGWDLLGEAKRAFDRAVNSGRLDEQRLRRAERQLAVCEGSDWFWWFGDYNPAESVSHFEHLFRQQLADLYRLIGEEPPESLSQVISRGGGAPQLGGVMRRGQEER